MLIEKFMIIFVELLLILLLSVRYIKKKYKENLIVIPLILISLVLYISFTLKKAYIPIYLQTCIFLFGTIIPIIYSFLQYNNITIRKKILYYTMKYYFISKEYNKTIKCINRLILIDGKTSEYLYVLGLCYKNLNDLINARDSFALATDLDKCDYRSYYELGLILDETNKKDTAIVMFNKAIKINPSFYEAREALGICLTRQGKFKAAIKVYKKALEKYPSSYEMYYNIAMLELEFERFEEAKSAFKKAGELKKDLYTSFYNLGNIHYMLGEYDDAIQAYKKILYSGVYGPKAYYKIALTYAVKKEYEKSMAALEYAIELDPKYVQEAKKEYVFESMRSIINRYLLDKEIIENREKERRNYMKYKFKIFKSNDIFKDDYSKNYYKNYDKKMFKSNSNVKHA